VTNIKVISVRVVYETLCGCMLVSAAACQCMLLSRTPRHRTTSQSAAGYAWETTITVGTVPECRPRWDAFYWLFFTNVYIFYNSQSASLCRQLL